MYLNDLSLLPTIISRAHFLILVANPNLVAPHLKFRGAIPILPNEKSTHDVDSIRQIESLARAKQTARQTFIIHSADQLTLAAQNAFLKLLEEPGDNISFLFLATDSSAFLPTILSRAKVFQLRSDSQSIPDPTILVQARTLVAGNRHDTIALANSIAKDRPRALEITQTAITELYRSQLSRPSPHFIARLNQLLALEQALQANGHVKLHLANMVQ